MNANEELGALVRAMPSGSRLSHDPMEGGADWQFKLKGEEREWYRVCPETVLRAAYEFLGKTGREAIGDFGKMRVRVIEARPRFRIGASRPEGYWSNVLYFYKEGDVFKAIFDNRTIDLTPDQLFDLASVATGGERFLPT